MVYPQQESEGQIGNDLSQQISMPTSGNQSVGEETIVDLEKTHHKNHLVNVTETIVKLDKMGLKRESVDKKFFEEHYAEKIEEEPEDPEITEFKNFKIVLDEDEYQKTDYEKDIAREEPI